MPRLGDERGFPWGTDGDTVIRRTVEELAQLWGGQWGRKGKGGGRGRDTLA